MCARRLLTKLNLDKIYQGNKQVSKYFQNEEDEERSSLKCYLDVGLNRTTTGANVFGALKGAVDGGLDIPYSGDRLAAGYYDKKSEKYNEAALADRIYGKHVADFMKLAKEDDEEWYKKQFSMYEKNGVNPDQLKSIYEKAHEAIRAKPILNRAKPSKCAEWEKAAAEKKAKREARIQERATARAAQKKAALAALKK